MVMAEPVRRKTLITLFAYYLINIAKARTLLITESMHLKNPNGNLADFFASCVAMDDKFIAIGSFRDDVTGKDDVGSVSVFTTVRGELISKLVPHDGKAGDYFGLSVALSGRFIAVGSLQDLGNTPSRGSVYFYIYTNGTNWKFYQKVYAEESSTSVQFGISVAVSNNLAVIGGGCAPGRGRDVAGFHVLNYNNSTWSHGQLLTTTDSSHDNTYGTSVAIGDGFIALGLSYVAINGSDYAGVVYLYHSNNGLWAQHTVIISSTPVKNGWFGRSISISGHRLVIGAEGENERRGNAYIYQYKKEQNTWTLEKVLKPTRRNSYHFGFSVSIEQDTILVGSFRNYNGTHVGGPIVFNLAAGNWEPRAELLESGMSGYDLFGRSLVVHNNTAVVGVYGKKVNNGSGYVYRIPSFKEQLYMYNMKLKGINMKQSIKGQNHSMVLLSVLIPLVVISTFMLLVCKMRHKTRRKRERFAFVDGQSVQSDGTDGGNGDSIYYIDSNSDNILLLDEPFT